MKGIVKAYQMGDELQVVLKGIDFSVRHGEFLSILGPSGSGKTTMMNIIGCLDTPNEGEFYLSGQRIADMDEKALARIRNKEIGFIFQQFQLLPRLTAVQNVELPLIYSRLKPSDRHKRALEMLDRVGLSEKIGNRPNQLSGGQQQRVAIARALANNPTILLADEPTGALDQTTGIQVMELFKELNDEGHTIIMITHNEKIAQYAGRVVHILDGNMFEGEAA
jgi:putative ABC transport system ATP-binding protein